MKRVLGIDLGGTSAKVGVVNQFGELEKNITIDNDENNLLENLVYKVMNALEEWGYDYLIDIDRIGFASPGFIDHNRGIVKIAGNLGWWDFDLKAELVKLFGNKKIYVLNDANAAALGEFWTGAASTYNSEIFYTLGTGVGGAIVLDGKLVSGENGFAGEFGHGGIMQSSIPCNCGLRFCLEPTTSPIKIIDILKDEINKNPKSNLAKLFVQTKELDFKTMISVYEKNGKPKEIKEFLINTWKPFFSHMSLMVSALNPKIIIIGGGPSAMGQCLIDIIEEGLNPLILNIYKSTLRIEIATLGNKAGMIGAAYYAINDWEY